MQQGLENLLRSVTMTVSTLALAAVLSAQGSAPVLFQGIEIENFLTTADIIHMEDTDRGITLPKKVTLEQDSQRHFAIFKTIDVFQRGLTTLRSGATDVDFQDSWKTEVAAYELDKLIGLGMVPTTVERRHGPDRGSMQWWIENAMVERDRMEKGIRPPDQKEWNEQTYKIRLFDNLIYNVDRNLNNILVTESWQVILIDHSRSFRSINELQSPNSMIRFSRSLLEAIEKLDEKTLEERLRPYLTASQISAVLERRDLILEMARDRIAESGAEAVLYD